MDEETKDGEGEGPKAAAAASAVPPADEEAASLEANAAAQPEAAAPAAASAPADEEAAGANAAAQTQPEAEAGPEAATTASDAEDTTVPVTVGNTTVTVALNQNKAENAKFVGTGQISGDNKKYYVLTQEQYDNNCNNAGQSGGRKSKRRATGRSARKSSKRRKSGRKGRR